MKRGNKLLVGVAALALLAYVNMSPLPVQAQVPQQCVTNAIAGGTPDAITIPLLPCALATNILILTVSGNNTTTTPTIQMAGYPAQRIYTNTLSDPGIGDFGDAGSVLMLTSTGSSWLIINGNVGGYIPLPLGVSDGGTGATTLTGAVQGHGTDPFTAGTLPVDVGGTGQTSYTNGQLLIGNGTGLSKNTLTAGTNVTISNSAGAITISSTGLASGCSTTGTGEVLTSNGTGQCTSNADATFTTGVLSLGTAGAEVGSVQLFNATSGSISLAPTTGALGSAVATLPANTGTLAELNLGQTWTGLQSFTGESSHLAMSLVNGKEPAAISATAATGTIDYDICSQSIIYYTSNASANWTVNFRCSAGTSLDSAMATGDVVTVVFLVTQGTTAYYNNAVTVDGNSVTPKYQGGAAWTAGNVSSIDAYTYAITKTGSAAFTIFASQTQFK